MNINIDTLIKDFVAFERKNKTHNGHYHFNLLEEQQGHIVENSHSNILTKLLQYTIDNRWLFLESFLSRLDYNDFDLCNKNICFKREHNNIDILIYSKDEFALIVENKINGARSRSNQIADYIGKTVNDNTIFDNIKSERSRRADKIWVVFLDRDGNDAPDSQSKKIIESDFIGKYKHANYREHILPWLENDVLPSIPYRDKELFTGVIQYIEYLKGENMFGINNNLNLHNGRVAWLKTYIDNHLESDNIKRNKQLQNIYLGVLRKRKDTQIPKKDRSSLLNALFTLSEEPLRVFIDTTESYFNNFNECNSIHHFTFYYYYITPIQWTGKKLRVSFGWETMGMKALARSSKYIFGIVISGPQNLREDFENCFGQRLKEMKYNKNNDITRLLNYRAEINTENSFLKMDDEKLRKALLDIYEKYASKELMSAIQDRFFK